MAQSVNLGEVPKSDDLRDALHIAVISGVAGEKLRAGQNVKIQEGVWMSCNISNRMAVVDPYIRRPLNKGDLFWACLMPNSVTDVKHVWTHPDFPVKEETAMGKAGFSPKDSEKWLREFVSQANCPQYNEVIAAAVGEFLENRDPEYYSSAYNCNSEHLYFAGRDAHGDIPPEFWDHVENATGKKCPHRPLYFSCSC